MEARVQLDRREARGSRRLTDGRGAPGWGPGPGVELEGCGGAVRMQPTEEKRPGLESAAAAGGGGDGWGGARQRDARRETGRHKWRPGDAIE
jgi:hypothetical protein